MLVWWDLAVRPTGRTVLRQLPPVVSTQCPEGARNHITIPDLAADGEIRRVPTVR